MSTPICFVKDCDKPPLPRWPLCAYHGAQFAHEFANGAALRAAEEHRKRLDAEARSRPAHKYQGDIYALRQNGLIKIGWSSDVWGRIHSYGPQVDILVHFPGSRADERDLHRSFRPLVARGREWYRDCDEIQRWVSEMLALHGKPSVRDYWSSPSAPAPSPRRSARKKPTGLS